jgi:hypothetical protein
VTTIHEPSGPIEVHTPRGKGVVMFVIDYSVNGNLYWVVNLYETGECWTFRNPEIRFVWNESAGTGKRPPGDEELSRKEAAKAMHELSAAGREEREAADRAYRVSREASERAQRAASQQATDYGTIDPMLKPDEEEPVYNPLASQQRGPSSASGRGERCSDCPHPESCCKMSKCGRNGRPVLGGVLSQGYMGTIGPDMENNAAQHSRGTQRYAGLSGAWICCAGCRTQTACCESRSCPANSAAQQKAGSMLPEGGHSLPQEAAWIACAGCYWPSVCPTQRRCAKS